MDAFSRLNGGGEGNQEKPVLNVKDMMLLGLFKAYREIGDDYYFSLSSMVDNNKNWREIAKVLYDDGLIEYPVNKSYYSKARITKKGIIYVEKYILGKER